MKRLSTLLLTLMIVTLNVAILYSQTVTRFEPGVVVQHPTAEQLRAKTSLMTRNAFGSIQAAINIPPTGPAYIYLSCGTYVENVVINRSDIRIEGEERGCVQIIPANPALPAISIDATSQISMGYDEVSDLTIICPTNSVCGDGLKITGRTDIGQPNDWHKFSRIGIYGGFNNGINIAGRTIWTEFDNVEITNASGNGINVVGNTTVNHLTFRNVRSAYNYNYGVYVNNTQTDLVNGMLFDKLNVEDNGTNTGLHDCAGLYMTGISQANIMNSYFEGNCLGNSADNKLADVRLTGTFNQSVNITTSVFNMQYSESGIYNDSTLTTGTYDGDKFTSSGKNKYSIYIATSHPMSSILIGNNFDSTPTIIPDGNGFSHVRTLAPLGLDYSAVTSVTNNTFDVSTQSSAILYYGPYTVHNITGGHVGQVLFILAINQSGHVLVNNAGGTGQISFPDGKNRIMNTGEGLLLYYDGQSWRPMVSASTTQSTQQ